MVPTAALALAARALSPAMAAARNLSLVANSKLCSSRRLLG
jgi:hypothetical protein